MFQLPPISEQQIQALMACVDTFVRANGVQAAPVAVELMGVLQQAQPVAPSTPKETANGED